MSDFVLRLARRAAGLAPTAVPRPPDLPTELLGTSDVEEPEMVDAWSAAPAAPTAPTAPGEPRSTPRESPPGVGEAAVPPSRAAEPALPALPTAPAARPAAEVTAVPARLDVGDADLSPRPEPAPRAEVHPAPPSPLPAPILAAQPEPRVAPEHPTDRAAELAVASEKAETAIPAVVIVRPEPRGAPETLAAAVQERRTVESDGEAADPPRLVTVMPAEPIGRGAEEEAGREAEAPLAMVAAAPSEAEHPAWPEAREAQEEPRIEVHIGRIELAPPPPVFVPPAPPARVPRGFGEQRLARRHLDRRWY